MGAEQGLAMVTRGKTKQTPPQGTVPQPRSPQQESCKDLLETHIAQVFSIIGGTDHVPKDKGDDAEDAGLLAVNLVTLLVVHNEHLGLLQLWHQRGIGCGGAQWGEPTPYPTRP